MLITRFVIYLIVFTSLLTSGWEITCISHVLAAPIAGQVQPSAQILPRAIAQAILNNAARHSGVKIARLKITQSRAKVFSNICVFRFGEVCSQQYDPIQGWIVNVKVKQQLWTYHVNQDGSQIILDPKISTLNSK